MTETQGLEHGLGRRALLRNALIAGAGVAALSALSIPLAGTAGAVTYQSDWAWCPKCNAFFWATAYFEDVGLCPGNSGGTHTVGGTIYSAMYGIGTSGNPANTSSSGQQAGWAYCSECHILGWKSNPGVCIATTNYDDFTGEIVSPGPHTYGTTNYAVPFGSSSVDGYQDGWDYCSACAILYWGGGWDKAAENCAATNFNGKHTPGSDTHYQAVYT